MNAYLKTVLRTVKSNAARFIAITFIILLGISFITGLGTLSYKIEMSLSRYMTEYNVADIIVKSTSQYGFSQSTVEKMAETDGVMDVQTLTSVEMKIDGCNARVYIMPVSEMKVNSVQLLSGRFPASQDEIVVERASDTVSETVPGDKINVFGQDKTVTGIVANPLIMYKGGEQNLADSEKVELIVYSDSTFNTVPFPVTDVYVKIDGTYGNLFSNEYINGKNSVVDNIKKAISDDSAVYLTLEENSGYAVSESYNKKIDVIALIFPVFFIAVAALVVLTTMSRLIEEERSAIGCYTTLGFGSGKIALKYLFFSLICCLIGCGGGFAIGIVMLPSVIYPAFNVLFFMPAITLDVDLSMGIIAAAAMIVAVIGVTAYLIRKETKEKPANLLRPKSPKCGKKIFLEHIPFIWKRLSFKYKSTCRNIFRYVKHLLMTVISVAGSTALVLAGFGLLNVAKSGNLSLDLSNIADSLKLISTVIIVFAILLCVLVIFNLTNMNIGERKREIATLKVLGYHDLEVSGYIFREVLIMSVLGILAGLLLGYGLMAFIFSYMDFGSVKDVEWYSYIFAAILVLLVIFLVDLLLHRKIKKIDMASSLKTVE